MPRPLLLFLLALLLPAAHAQPAADLPEAVVSNVQARVDAGENEGVVVAVVDEEGARTFSLGRRSAERPEAPDARTVFEIGSVTKVFNAILLAEMAARGEVALGDPIAGYLPDSVQTSFGDRVTLEHLATHTSGLPRLPSNFAATVTDPANPYADYTVEDLYAFLASHELEREPGAEAAYSNLGAGLLGHLLARHVGMNYGALLHERVLDPLGLDDTVIALSDGQRERLAPGHSEGRGTASWDFPTLAGAGALRSTADDMLRFLAANLGLVETPLEGVMQTTHARRGGIAGDSLSAGLGWMIREADGGELVWHNGGTGGYRSFVGFDPEARRGVVVLTNSDRGLDDVGFHLLDPAIPLETPRATADVAPEVLERYVGQYQLAPGFFITVTLDGGRLYGQATGQQAFRLYPASETEFFLKAVEAEVTFTVEDGEVRGLVLHQGGRDMPGQKVE